MRLAQGENSKYSDILKLLRKKGFQSYKTTSTIFQVRSSFTLGVWNLVELYTSLKMFFGNFKIFKKLLSKYQTLNQIN